MARMLIKDTCETARRIMDGELDADLTYILEACAARKKNMYRKGTKIRLVGTKNVSLDGKEGVVTKVNAKTVSVGIGAPSTEFGMTYYPDGEYNVPLSMLEVIA